ncbi:hypothetical protein [Bacillus massilinigeriensis]|uniref:hypothetical protein n=1 Tax=Bacillus mediterraneensis TaxID=1805474 RepID=UPI00114D4086|nr:hypothetical protein [Bacillus mediterraneensis]
MSEELNSALLNLKSSIETQVDILQRFKPVFLNDGIEIPEKLGRAQADAEDAIATIEQIETELEVIYTED